MFWHSRFCDWERKWQLLHVPGETSIRRRHTPVQLLVADIPHPCLLSLKTDRKQRKRGESLFDCRQAPEAAAEHCLANKNKLIHKVLTALRAAVFMKKQMAQEEWTMLVNHFLSLFFNACCLVTVILALCIPTWSELKAYVTGNGGFHSSVYFYANYMPINDELSLFSLDNLIII